eukprot:gnl/TRDRNA2_/TRDRNA2_92264_c0_seq1.p1 gnl/TRDRNA2_/TRDRNA2_92264_c0~~gnl/TRDRNA2_/TRDRNA2_92264_c0_seq1.p1  ORF type:complete len:653 (-),score=69.03 gnl/TRDRNA2_/TRDRNA2_92264_c0_seq1:86-1930(-)
MWADVHVGGYAGQVYVPPLREGGFQRYPCSEIREGYDGFIEARCLGQILTIDVSRCGPSKCKAGVTVEATLAEVRSAPAIKPPISVQRTTAFVTVTRDLAHRDVELVTCRSKFPGQSGSIRLFCNLGKVEVDTTSCHPSYGEARTVWRLMNEDHIPGTWRVFDVSFHSQPDCSEASQLLGRKFTSSDDILSQELKANAFDGIANSSWAARCNRGCAPLTAWLGNWLPEGEGTMVRCVRVLQSQVSCCSTRHMRLEVWDGSGWQNAQMWDVQGRVLHAYGYDLPVPITCTKGKPEGVGVIHDCDGPPVVGRQDGDVCTARCREGFYGDTSKFMCGSDGSFSGTSPACYELESAYQFFMAFSVFAGIMLLSQQYQFWKMHKKVRINSMTEERGDTNVPPDMLGRWAEQDNRTHWQVLRERIKERKDRHGDFDALEDMVDALDEEAAADMAASAGIAQAVDDMRDVDDEEAASSAESRDPLEDKFHDPRWRPTLDGLCHPCEDPDICCATILCPLCRIADTWHTLGHPKRLNYWTVIMAYLFCPCCAPCLNFYGRYRIRKIFMLPEEPHRDCLVHCCCCCLCAPCAICQEARQADAPAVFHMARIKLEAHDEKNEMS